ncbi:hypothetical protein FC605_01200 [Bacillus subtilis]|nr:hypothetical protein BSK2_01195 [Bacillus subtilis]AXC51525.1 hypothetical protein DQ231_01065 [Bacillus spizizenii]PTN35117.1 hypothetical protein DAD79_04880 [Bacillus sp. Rc4]KIO56764.1 hypothetical protein B4143_0192 [Bacillus subtilis]MBA5717089.1 hypothetical protein [Bacillus subtilis]
MTRIFSNIVQVTNHQHQIHVFKIDVKKHPLITTADVRSFDRNNKTVYYELTSLYVRLGYE